MTMRPIHGIRVLDFTRVVSGPYCTYMLGLLGAEIIKVEDRNGGDSVRQGVGDSVLKAEGLAAVFVMFNGGKKSITLDLKKPEAKEIVFKLARECDVLVENFRAGVIDRLGLGYEALKQVNPRLIYCSISGFGQSGPDARAPAFDGNVQAMSGMMAITGEPDGVPMRAGYSIGDTGTGVHAALAIVSALYQRNTSGVGQYIDVAMLDSAISLLSQSASGWLNAGIVQKRRGNISINREPTSDVFKTADGSVMLAVMRDEHVALLLPALGLAQYVVDARFVTREARVANSAFIRPLIETELKKATSAEWKARLDRAGVPCSMVLELADALSQPQVVHRGLVCEAKDERTGRPMLSFTTPYKFAHDGPAPSFPAQRLGAQNEEVLGWLGYNPDEIAELARREVI
jgi:crotonobetainyl-CoA:carnitine CoA-transferase CaiB-like acyl-CoA transferase